MWGLENRGSAKNYRFLFFFFRTVSLHGNLTYWLNMVRLIMELIVIILIVKTNVQTSILILHNDFSSSFVYILYL